MSHVSSFMYVSLNDHRGTVGHVLLQHEANSSSSDSEMTEIRKLSGSCDTEDLSVETKTTKHSFTESNLCTCAVIKSGQSSRLNVDPRLKRSLRTEEQHDGRFLYSKRLPTQVKVIDQAIKTSL